MDRKSYLLNIATLAQLYGFTPIPVRDKTPRFKNWQDVRVDPNDPGKTIRRINHLYDAGLVNNIAIVTGEASNVMVVDVDVPALNWWNELLRINPPLPETFLVLTPSGGYHYYFRYIPGLTNMNKILGQALDFRSTRGMIIFPGSQGTNGEYYKVAGGYENNQPIIADIPNWLLQLLQYNNSLK
jgi:hypothetical protein